MPCPDVPPLSEIPELNGIGLGYGTIPSSDVPAIDEERWIEGNGGLIHFYSRGPSVANRFSPEALVAESLVENWWLKRACDRAQMVYRLDLVCNRVDFHSIPIDFCQFDLAGSDIGRRISGEGTYIDQYINHHEDRIIQVDARSLTLREDGPRSFEPPAMAEFGGNLYIQRGEAGHTVCQMISPGYGIGSRDGVDSAENKPKVNEKAEKLLLSFLDPKQQQDYRKLGHFGYLEEAAKREWRFYFRYHYPVEFYRPDVGFIGLCIELENETPTEDILLMCLLEVRGGHGNEIIKAGHRMSQPPMEGLRPEAPSDLTREMQRLSGTARRAVLTAERFREQIQEQELGVIGIPQQWISEEEGRRTAIEVQNIAL